MFRLFALITRLFASKTDETPREPASTAQVAGIIGVACVITNIAFYFLSDIYFRDRTAVYGAATAEHIQGVRIAFAVFTASVGVTSIVASVVPKYVGHIIAALTGVAMLFAGVLAAVNGMTPVLPAALILCGLVMPFLAWKSLEGKRGAWSFLIGMCAVLAAVLLFGATKVRGVLGVGLWTALIIPGMLVVATVALNLIADDYRES